MTEAGRPQHRGPGPVRGGPPHTPRPQGDKAGLGGPVILGHPSPVCLPGAIHADPACPSLLQLPPPPPPWAPGAPARACESGREGKSPLQGPTLEHTRLPRVSAPFLPLVCPSGLAWGFSVSLCLSIQLPPTSVTSDPSSVTESSPPPPHPLVRAAEGTGSS